MATGIINSRELYAIFVEHYFDRMLNGSPWARRKNKWYRSIWLPTRKLNGILSLSFSLRHNRYVTNQQGYFPWERIFPFSALLCVHFVRMKFQFSFLSVAREESSEWKSERRKIIFFGECSIFFWRNSTSQILILSVGEKYYVYTQEIVMTNPILCLTWKGHRVVYCRGKLWSIRTEGIKRIRGKCEDNILVQIIIFPFLLYTDESNVRWWIWEGSELEKYKWEKKYIR